MNSSTLYCSVASRRRALPPRRRRRQLLVVVLALERRAHGAVETHLPRRDLAQRQHRRLVLRLDQRPCPCHELPGALGREQDQREAVVDERQAVFDGDTSHAGAPEKSETGWIPDPPRLRNGFPAYLLACGGAGGASSASFTVQGHSSTVDFSTRTSLSKPSATA